LGKGKNMPDMIAYCALNCAECKAFKATQAKDYEGKKQLAQKWTVEDHVEFSPEDIDCDGCMSNRISGWCRKICKIRPCAEERKVTTCAHCDDYPCEKLKEFLLKEPVAKKNLEDIWKTLHVC
jgi:hypothetical protein